MRRRSASSQSLVSLNKSNSSHSTSSQRDIESTPINGHKKISFDISGSSTNNNNMNAEANSLLMAEIPPAPRSESMAYAAHSRAATLKSKFVHFIQFNTKAFVAGVGLLLVVLVLVTEGMDEGSGGGMHITTKYMRGRNFQDHWGGAVHPGYFNVQDSIIDDHTFRFAAVTDLDKLSLVKDSNKPLFRSTLLPGILTRDDATNKYSIKFDPPRNLVSYHNEAGRGMELSELTIYKKRLLSFDDRTGTVFEILSTPDGKDSYVVPRFVITEGDGDTDKGMKWEWATIKNNELILGSMGKEFTGPGGVIENTNNLWVAVLNERGELRRDDWKPKFDFVRQLVGATYPGCE